MEINLKSCQRLWLYRYKTKGARNRETGYEKNPTSKSTSENHTKDLLQKTLCNWIMLLDVDHNAIVLIIYWVFPVTEI